MSYCLAASCLAHRERMFWQPPWGVWVHAAGMYPCEAMVGQEDPTALRCCYCGVLVQVDGPRLVSYRPEVQGEWRQDPEGCWWSVRWFRNPWLSNCPVSPTFHHEVTRMRFT